MNQKPEIPGEDNRMKKHPAKRPSKLEVDRKLKPPPEEDPGHEAAPRSTGRHPAPRLPMPRDARHHDGKRAA